MSTDLLKAAFDALDMPVWIVALSASDIEYANPRARTLCGWRRGSPRQTLGNLTDLLSLEIDSGRRAITLDDLRQMTLETGNAGAFIGWLRTPAGGVRLLLSAGAFDTPRTGANIVLTGVAKRADVISPPSLPSVSTVAQCVAHELNNIGASLMGFLELAAEQTEPESPLGHSFPELRVGVSRLVALAAILELLSEEEGKFTPVTAAECVVSMAGEDSNADYQVIWKCAPSTPVYADADLVRQTLRVMVPLAAAAGIGGGAAAYTVGHSESGAEACSFCGVISEGSLRISVPDNVRRGGIHTLPHLIAAAAAHSIHCAGGHVVLEGPSFSILLRAVGRGPKVSDL